MKTSKLFFTVLFLIQTFVIDAQNSFTTSGSEDIDRVRKEIVINSTTKENFREHSVLMYMWVGTLQHLGADLRSFYDIDKKYYQLENQVNRKKGKEKIEATQKMTVLIDAGFAKLEEIHNEYLKNGSIFKPFESDGKGFPKGGNMDAEWPMFQSNKHNNGYSEAPGPKYGRTAWKFPVGLGWYVRPVIENGSVYVTSPGMYTTCFKLSLKTGKILWKSTQEHPLFGIYKYPAMMSTPVIQGDKIILREVNSHGGNKGQAKNLVYIDKNTGKTISKSYAGHVDYRTQNAPVASNDDYVVYPFGVSDIYQYPPVCQNFNRLICKDKNNKKQMWDFNVGDIDALAEPVLSKYQVFQGTTEGYLYALNLKPGVSGQKNFNNEQATNEKKLIAWNFKAEGAINTKVLLDDGKVYFGANDGVIYCLNEVDGKLLWSKKVNKIEKRARKHFTNPLIDNDVLYIGSANKNAYAIDVNTGDILWKKETKDWIRAKPVATKKHIYFADVQGNIYKYKKNGKQVWCKQISTHPIFADLTISEDKIVLNDSNLLTFCLNLDGKVIWKHSILSAYWNNEGERIFTDVLSGGTYYQSKPTAANNKLFFGNPAGFLYAVDVDTGKEKWKFEMGGAISVGPAIMDGKVYVGQQGGERFFYCLDAETGEVVWKQTVPGGWVWGSATVDDGLVYVPTVNGYAVCLDGKTGHIVWMYPTAKSVPAEPAIDGDIVYFGSWSRSLYAFNKKTGKIIWKANGVGLDSGTLISQDGKIYLPHHSNIFMSFNSKTGEILTEGNTNESDKGKYTNFNASPAFHNGKGFFTARVGIGLKGVPLTSKVYSVYAKTAKVNWTFPDGGGLSAPALANGRLYIGSGNYPYLYCLDQETGKLLWNYKMGTRIEESTLCIYRDKVFALAGDGYVHAVE